MVYFVSMLQYFLADAKIFFILVGLSLLLVLADQFSLLTKPKSIIHIITSPIQYGMYKSSLGIGRQFEFIVLARRASKENKALGEQLAQVLSENARLRRKLAEANAFLDQERTLDPKTFNLVPARPTGIGRYLVIDRGSENGIKTGQVVVYKDNYIGEIKNVETNKSQVMLLTDPDSKVAAFVTGDFGKARGVLVGQFGSEMLLDKILHHEPISKEDLVYSEGSELEIPRGLILGRVTNVLERDNEVFKQAIVQPVFDASSLDVVFIVSN